MDSEKMLDEVFQVFVNHLEAVYTKCGAGWVSTEINHYDEKDIDDLMWEIEEEFCVMPSKEEQEECFDDAVNYIDSLYNVRAQQALETLYAI